MQSPFPESSSAAGDGHIIAKPLPAGGTGLEAMTYQYPLKLISPSPKVNDKSVLVFLLSYGGGLVGGDSIDLNIHVKPGAKLSVVTQGHTKIFKSPSSDIVTSQRLSVRCDDGSALCLLPDPVQPFAESFYSQVQQFRVSPASSLCLLDWVTRGRSARGEDWSFGKWTGRNEVWAVGGSGTLGKDRLLVRDIVVLSASDNMQLGHSLKAQMRGLGIFGTLILHGSMMDNLGDFLLGEFEALPRIGSRDFRTDEARLRDQQAMNDEEKWRAGRIAMEKETGLLWSAARVRGCVVAKFAARNVEDGRAWIGAMLEREGSIEAQFGEQALMCVK